MKRQQHTSRARDPRRLRIAGMVLAAGRGRRFRGERPKQLAAMLGEPLVCHACRALLGCGVDPAILVVGFRGQAVARAALETATQARAALEVVANPAWRSGLSSSVAAGLAQVPQGADALLLVPADQPLLAAHHLSALLETYRRTGAPMVAAADGAGRPRGAPALFARSRFALLARLEGDSGAGAILAGATDDLLTVPIPDEALMDVDTADDLVRLEHATRGLSSGPRTVSQTGGT